MWRIASAVILLNLADVGLSTQQDIVLPSPENEPNWILLLSVFIASSAIAAVIGVVALVKKPFVRELPEFHEPNFDLPEPAVSVSSRHNVRPMVSLDGYPMENEPETYPLERMRSHKSEAQMSQRSHYSTMPTNQSIIHQPQPIYPNVVTHRM